MIKHGIYKGYRCFIERRRDDRSWIGDEFEVIDFCLPLIVVKHVNEPDNFTSYQGHLFNLCSINVTDVQGHDVDVCLAHPDHDKVANPTSYSQLRAGDPFVTVGEKYGAINIALGFKGNQCYYGCINSSSFVNNIIKCLFYITMVEQNYYVHLDMSKTRVAVLPQSFVFNYCKSQGRLREYHRLFSGADKCCTCQNRYDCKVAQWRWEKKDDTPLSFVEKATHEPLLSRTPDMNFIRQDFHKDVLDKLKKEKIELVKRINDINWQLIWCLDHNFGVMREEL